MTAFHPGLEAVTSTPELLLDEVILRRNIERTAEAAKRANMRLRPHVKTHKSPWIAELQVASGAVGIQVAKLGEAEVMANAGMRDILVGYQIVGDEKLRRLRALADRTILSVLVDSLAGAIPIAKTVAATSLRVGAYIEVDTGLHRTGVPPGTPAVDLARRISDLAGLEFLGFLTHEGQAVGSARSRNDVHSIAVEAYGRMIETANLARFHGLHVATISVGCSVTFQTAVAFEGIDEVRPGTYVFNDRTQLTLGTAMLEDIAAVIAATVISVPRPGEVVVDAGTKVLSSDPLPGAVTRSYGCIYGTDWEIVRASEEHGVVSVPIDAPVRIGDRLMIVPNHICPVFNLHDQVTLHASGKRQGEIAIAARGRSR